MYSTRSFQAEEREQKKKTLCQKEERQKNQDMEKRTNVDSFWTGAISMTASLHGWQSSEPISLPHWNLLKSQESHCRSSGTNHPGKEKGWKRDVKSKERC